MRPVSLIFALAAGCSDYEYAELGTTERFVQVGDDAMADVLFVIDNSASMGEEQGRLLDNFLSFVDVLKESYADYQIGVTTTDVADGGRLNGPGILTPDTPNLEVAFMEAVTVGTEGSRDEQGLATAILALTVAAPELVRDQSQLSIVWFSDEDDGSPEDLAYYLSTLEEIAGQEGFVAHAIVGDMPSGCASGVTAADPGTRYIDLVSITNGYRDSICSADYSDILANVGLEVAGLNPIFYLSGMPQSDSIRVWVDDVEIPQREVDGWTYSIGDNAIVFSGRAIPRPRMEVFVEYQLLSGVHVGEDTGGGG